MKAMGWIALGGAAVVVLDYLGVINVSWLNGYITPVSGTSTTPQAATTQQTTGNNTLSAIAAAVTADGLNPLTALMSVSKWNFYYAKVRGVAGPDPGSLFPTNSNAATENFTLAEWWSAMTGAGFSGLGMIAHYVNPYLQGPRHAPHAFGAGLAPTGPETMIRRVN